MKRSQLPPLPESPENIRDDLWNAIRADESARAPGAEERLNPDLIEAAGSVADAIEAAVNAYRWELDFLTLYGPGGRAKLRSLIAGKLPFEALPSDLREDLLGRFMFTLVPIGTEPYSEVWQIRGDFHDAFWAINRARAHGGSNDDSSLPEISATDLERIKARAKEILSMRLARGQRIRARETAMRHLVETLSNICRPSPLLKAAKSAAPGRGRRKDLETMIRRNWVLEVLRENGLRASARLLREAIPSLHRKELPRKLKPPLSQSP